MKTTDQILKIKSTVLYILEKMPKGMDYIHLFKTLYFAQQEHLVRYGMPIMDDSFMARKHGPVAALTYKVLRGVEGKVNVTDVCLIDFMQSVKVENVDGHQIVTIADGVTCDKEELSVSNIKVLDKWIDKCKDIESFDLSDLSHDNAWQTAKSKTELTGEDTKITLYDMAKAAGANDTMLGVIRERQINSQELQWI
ncbi:MAG: SocA family protein [Bacteroidales bacterium]|nr:SocA family protein [Candidatus Sodaliphilus aphodohippi]